MGQRHDLHVLLKSLLPEGKEYVYFQAPNNTMMQYPCIVYGHDASSTKFAGNLPYNRKKRYQVTIIDADPDSVIPDKVAELPESTFRRRFVSDKLNHNIYNLYF